MKIIWTQVYDGDYENGPRRLFYFKWRPDKCAWLAWSFWSYLVIVLK
ncbi:MAG: hypothetical protein ACKVOB_13535 [Sphingomonas sp.]